MQKTSVARKGLDRAMPGVGHRNVRVRCPALKAVTVSPGNAVARTIPTTTQPSSIPLQQSRFSYINLKASAADFQQVIFRLAAASSLSAEARAAPAATVAAPQPQASAPWDALLKIMGGLRGGSHAQASSAVSSVDNDDSTPLSHAVVMFTATWCGPCSIVHREIKVAAGRLQGRPPTAILVVDVEENQELASQLGIKALPTLLYLGPDGSRGPIFTQGPVSASFILDALDRAASFGGRDVAAKWLKL